MRTIAILIVLSCHAAEKVEWKTYARKLTGE